MIKGLIFSQGLRPVPGIGVVRCQTQDLGIGHGSPLHVLEGVETLGMLQPHPCQVEGVGVDKGGEKREGLGWRA